MTDGGSAEKGRSWGRTLLRMAGLALCGALVAAGLLIAFPPVEVLRDQLARDLSEATGRTVTLGNAKIDYAWPPELIATFNDLAVSNPEDMPKGHLLKAREVDTRIALLPLLKGRVHLTALGFVEPKLTLEEAADGKRNWIFDDEAQPAAAPAPAAASKEQRVKFPSSIVIEEASAGYLSAKSGTSRLVEDINALVAFDEPTGAATVKGTVVLNKERLAFAGSLGDTIAAGAGRNTSFNVSLNGKHVTASLKGDAQFTAAAEMSGYLESSTGSLQDLMKWLGFDASVSGDPFKTALTGNIKATTRDVTFVEADISVNGTSGVLDGQLDYSGTRPRFDGSLKSGRIDLSRFATRSRPGLVAESLRTDEVALEVDEPWEGLLTDLEALESGGARAAALDAVPESVTAGAAASWSEQPFDLKAISALDANLIVTANEVTLGTLDLKGAEIHTNIEDGMLIAKVEKLAVGEGKATGSVKLDSRAVPPRAEIAISMTDVAAEPIVTELTGQPFLAGTSNVDFTAKAQGQNQSQLASTLEGKARFKMAKGAIRGFDIRRMISEWWRKRKFDLATKTSFETLEARYDIKKGVLQSEPGLALGGSEVEINSVGNVSLPAKRIDQEIRIKVVPPPTALPIPVRISGPWSKPSIGIDWGTIFAGPVSGLAPSAAPEFGGPEQIATATEPPPPEVESAIRRVLSLDLPPERLSPQGKKMLEQLIVTEEPRSAEPQ